MFKVLVAQSETRFQLECCIHQGMEMNFAYDSLKCFSFMKEIQYDALVLSTELEEKEDVTIHEILHEAENQRIPVFCIIHAAEVDVLKLLFDYSISYCFFKPISYHDILNKLNELKGTNERVDVEKRVSELLHRLGIPNSIQGYSYLLDAVAYCTYHQEYLKGITKTLYPMLAKEYQTTAGAVEKSIRHAIEMAFSYSEQTYLYEFFKGTIRADKAKATNSQFISMCVEYIKTERL